MNALTWQPYFGNDINEKGKEMFYLTSHSTHFIYGYMVVRNMVKDHSDSEKGNLLPPLHRLFFPISSKSSFITPFHRQDSTYNSICFYTCRGALAGTRNSSMGPPKRIDLTTHRTMSHTHTPHIHTHTHRNI